MSTKPKPHLPVVAATTEAEEAQAVAEDLRIRAASIQGEADAAQRIANAAALERTRLELERRDRLNETTIALATDAIAKANADAEAALFRFRAHLAEQPWLVDLVDYLAAKLTARAWATERNGANLQLLGPGEVHAGVDVWEPEPTVSIESLVAGIVSSAAHDVRAVREAAVKHHRAAFLAGETDDPTPPADRP